MRSWPTPLAALLLAVCLAVAPSGCAVDETEAQSADPAATIEGILFGGGGDCLGGSDCASGVCVSGFCIDLSEAGQTWMERTIAAKVRDLAKADPRAADLLEESLPRLEEDPFVQGRAAGMLGALGDLRFVPVLERWAGAPEERVRVRALLALGELGHRPSFEAVLGLLEHRSEAVVLCAAEALGSYLGVETEPLAVATLLGLLRSGRHRVRQRALAVIGRMRGPAPAHVASALLSLVKAEEDGFLRYDAVRVLSKLAPDRAGSL